MGPFSRHYVSSIRKDGFNSLVSLTNHLTTHTGKHNCPEPYREFLSKISPACGVLQVGDNREVVNSLQKVAQNAVNI